MEPRPDICLPFLQPLLDAPGSRYHLRSWPDELQWQPEKYVAEGLLHDVDGRGGASPTTEVPNNSILLVANVAGQSFLGHSARRGHAAHSKALDFANAAKHNSGFQRHGPTRLLMWMADVDKRSILPRSVGYRGKLAALMEANLDVEEIVETPTSTKGAIRREDALELESNKRVTKRMQEQNIQIPLHRQAKPPNNMLTLSITSRDWHKELDQLEEAFKTQKLSQFVGMPPSPLIPVLLGGSRKLAEYTPEYKRMATLRGVLAGQNVAFSKANQYMQRQEEIDELDLKLHRERTSARKQEEELKILDSTIRDYQEQLETLSMKMQHRVLFLDDDRRAFAMDPPLLTWDRRTAEPLVAEVDEFYVAKELALLDFQPKTTNQFPMTSEQYLYFDVIATSLLGLKGPTTLKILNRMAPGAYEALVPKVPAIRDPTKGGRRDVESVRARVLTPEMLHGLAIAWDNWVFKPPVADTLAQFSASYEYRARERKGIIARSC